MLDIDLSAFDYFAYDTETTGLAPHRGARVFGFSISAGEHDYYYDIRQTPQAVRWLNDQFSKLKKTKVICHNASFDYRMSKASGINPPINLLHDTILNAALINEHEISYSLDALAAKYTDVRKEGATLYERLKTQFGGLATANVQMKNLPDAPIDIVADYAKADTRATLELYRKQCELIEQQELSDILRFELQLMPILIKNEMHGVRVDTDAAERAKKKLTKQITSLQKKLDSIVGFACNVNAPAHMHKIFKPKKIEGRWEACDGTILQVTDTGNASINIHALRNMQHPAAALIIDLRETLKTRDTFIDGHILNSQVNNRVFPTIHQSKSAKGSAVAGTATGRLSYSEPAMQQIPERNKVRAEIVKKIFLPEENQVWIDTDMSSFEVRIFAHYVNNNKLLDAYKKNSELDMHQYVADITNLPRNPTRSGEANAKQLNLAMMYNQSAGSSAEMMGLPWEWTSFINREGETIKYKKAGAEALVILEKYHHNFVGVKELINKAKSIAMQRGFLKTRYGRRLRFPDKRLCYKAIAVLCQSAAADENKKNWLLINEVIKDTSTKLLLNVHDSYSFSIEKNIAKNQLQEIKNNIEQNRGLRIPLILEVNKPGATWWQSKKARRWF